jgi:hypothetical protein
VRSPLLPRPTEPTERIAEFLGELGVLVYTDYREVARSDLIGQYVGQTAPRVQALFKSNLERVLFLDEAYGLTRYEQDKTSFEKNARKLESFSDEAITELLTLFNKFSGRNKFIPLLPERSPYSLIAGFIQRWMCVYIPL